MRYYKRDEYVLLKPEQKKELLAWREQYEKEHPNKSWKYGSKRKYANKHRQRNEVESNKKFKSLESTIAALQSDLYSLKNKHVTIIEEPTETASR